MASAFLQMGLKRNFNATYFWNALTFLYYSSCFNNIANSPADPGSMEPLTPTPNLIPVGVRDPDPSPGSGYFLRS
uniref:Uncharacterized protein n=1 Tax=Panagrellus redivivus TaxID=6233 RepID=A0A7E4ZVF7_PANRE